VTAARAEILRRIRVANAAAGADGDSGPPAPRGYRVAGELASPAPRGYRVAGELASPALLDLLADRLADYRATVRRTGPGQLGEVISRALAERGVRRVVIPPGLDLPPLPAGVAAVTDDGLSPSALDGFDGAITEAAVAIAETGTIVLDGSPGQGRRAISLVPDYHLCIVRAEQVVELVPEAVARLGGARPAGRSAAARRAGARRAAAGRAVASGWRPALTWISGPSATSDIELRRVEGVHGPRTLEVILVGPAGADPTG
jgi:L-lactate dehydrogenase complex protein LldG